MYSNGQSVSLVNLFEAPKCGLIYQRRFLAAQLLIENDNQRFFAKF